MLGAHAQVAADGGQVLPQLHAKYARAACCGGDEPSEHGDGGGLASAIVPQQHKDLALIHLHVNARHCHLEAIWRVKVLGQPPQGHALASLLLGCHAAALGLKVSWVGATAGFAAHASLGAGLPLAEQRRSQASAATAATAAPPAAAAPAAPEGGHAGKVEWQGGAKVPQPGGQHLLCIVGQQQVEHSVPELQGDGAAHCPAVHCQGGGCGHSGAHAIGLQGSQGLQAHAQGGGGQQRSQQAHIERRCALDGKEDKVGPQEHCGA